MTFVAEAVRGAIARAVQARTYRALSRAEIFEHVYRTNAWGGPPGQPYSGRGSGARFAGPYATAVRGYLLGVGARSVIDLGCGDFQVGSRLTGERWTYTGVEIVDELVQANRRRFADERVSFIQGDICEGGLPPADVCLVRQVLQHLPNEDIERTLQHLRAYPVVIVTEHLPRTMLRPNLDKRPGPGVRASKGSGVVLHEPPFSWPKGACLLRLPANWSRTEALVTTVYEPTVAAGEVRPRRAASHTGTARD